MKHLTSVDIREHSAVGVLLFDNINVSTTESALKVLRFCYKSTAKVTYVTPIEEHSPSSSVAGGCIFWGETTTSGGLLGASDLLRRSEYFSVWPTMKSSWRSKAFFRFSSSLDCCLNWTTFTHRQQQQNGLVFASECQYRHAIFISK